MFISNFTRKSEPRRFTFTPYYYKQESDGQSVPDQRHRIRFKRIRRHQMESKKSVKAKIVFAVILAIVLYMYWGLIQEDQGKFNLDDIKIEETPIFE